MRIRLLSFVLALAAMMPAAAEPIEQAVQPGDRLDISNFAGEIRISTWSEDRLRVSAELRGQDAVRIERRGAVLRVRADSWDKASDSLAIFDDERAVLRLDGKQKPGIVVYTILVPAWLPVTASGAQTDVTVEGLKASMEISLFEGDVDVRHTQGDLTVRSLSGTITVEDTAGNLKVRGWQVGTRLLGTRGDLTVETSSGDIEISGHAGGGIEALTVAGDIKLEGALPESGVVSLATHSGDVTLGLPADTGASVVVRRVRASFESDFPVEVPDKKNFRFQLGNARTVLKIESFSGAIRLEQRD